LWREAGLGVGPSDTPAALERTRRRDPDLFLVAESEGRLVGAALGRFDGRRGTINHLAVAREVRSRGLGARLVREVERRLTAKGCAKLNLHVEPSNAGVIRFYETVGYRRREMLFLEKWLIGGPTASARNGSGR
jgi:ribosomal protein S18 acetylase RimI-like enzyme